MKTNKLIKKYYKAIIKGNQNKQRRLWLKALRKSLKGKRTQVIV